jgi:PAS domain-containing protein
MKNAWAGALIEFRRLEGVYAQAESASGVGLFTSDGTALLLAMPEAQLRAAEGSNIAGSKLFQWAARGPDSGVLEGISPFSGRSAIVAYNRVTGYPILVFAARRRAEALTDWYGRRRNTVLLGVGATLFVIVTTWILNYFLRALRRRELHYRALFNNAAFGAFVLEGERIIQANRTSAAMCSAGNRSAMRSRAAPPVSSGSNSGRAAARRSTRRWTSRASTPTARR